MKPDNKQIIKMLKISDNKQDALLLLVPQAKRKQANKLLLEIIDLEIEIEQECNQ